MPTDKEIEAGVYAVMLLDTCGYTIDGMRTTCYAEVIGDIKDAYNEDLKRKKDNCDCHKLAKAALEAAEKVRMEVTTKQEEGLSRDFKRVKEVKTLGEAFSIAYACEIALEKSITERFTKREEKLREALSILYTDAVLVESGQRMSRNTVKDLINNAIQQPVT